MKRRDYSSDVSWRRQIEKGGGKKCWQTIHVCHLVLPRRGLHFLISPSQFFPAISFPPHPPAIVSPLGTEARRCSSEPFLLKARGRRSEEPLVSGFNPRGLEPQGGASRAGLPLRRHVGVFAPRMDA